MDNVSILPVESLGRNFIPKEYLPEGQDEYYLRNQQSNKRISQWRNLTSSEVARLVNNNNIAENWDDILVTSEFDPSLVINSEFFGLVRIGKLQRVVLEHHDLRLPAGITNSTIVACDIGDDVAIHDVCYLAHYIIGNRCLLVNINEMHTTNHSKFGNGILKEGEEEDVRVWLDIINETGSRQIIPFDGMIPADAYIWAKYRDDTKLQQRLKEITQGMFDSRRGYYGTVGDQCVIKNSRILKDVKMGEHCYIKGTNKLKNLTINSSEEEPVQIGEGVELVNGIIGYNCHIFYGCKAVRFIMGNNSNLKYGARLINSFLGDNSTISCCEVLNNLIFPAHEQHHNNSFLIASLVLGQSNLAAGATIGSNHNSRANDNEIQAGRGFWPGLCCSVKHSCRFASFILLSKADYPAELDIRLPFSLLNNNSADDRLEVMPGYWWLYNMYALARNSWKFQARDKRRAKVQNIEFDCLAPDTVEEMITARRLLEIWTAKASLRAAEQSADKSDDQLSGIGKKLLNGPAEKVAGFEVLGEKMEKSRRKVLVLKPYEGYHAYSQMIHYYGVKNVMAYRTDNSDAKFATLGEALAGQRVTDWANLGGQIVPVSSVAKLRKDIGGGKLSSWAAIHERYEELWKVYSLEKQKHAYAALCYILGTNQLTANQWTAALDTAVGIQQTIRDRVYSSRQKDYDNPFRLATYRDMDEMTAAIGTIDDNSFIKQVRGETDDFKKAVEDIKMMA